jgi:drug/metabolite transporter (DMT)-like permease
LEAIEQVEDPNGSEVKPTISVRRMLWGFAYLLIGAILIILTEIKNRVGVDYPPLYTFLFAFSSMLGVFYVIAAMLLMGVRRPRIGLGLLVIFIGCAVISWSPHVHVTMYEELVQSFIRGVGYFLLSCGAYWLVDFPAKKTT